MEHNSRTNLKFKIGESWVGAIFPLEYVNLKAYFENEFKLDMGGSELFDVVSDVYVECLNYNEANHAGTPITTMPLHEWLNLPEEETIGLDKRGTFIQFSLHHGESCYHFARALSVPKAAMLDYAKSVCEKLNENITQS